MRTADAVTTGAGPLSPIYANERCLVQNGNSPMVYEAVVEAGNGGPAMLFWQASAWTQSAPAGLKVQPVVGGEQDVTIGSAQYLNFSAIHTALLRRRALLTPLSPGESLVNCIAAGNVVTDQNDVVTMSLVNLGAMAVPPQVRLSAWGLAEGTNNAYTAQTFSCDGGPLLISVSATAWSKTAAQKIGAVLYLDGEIVAYPQLFANQDTMHLGLVGTDKVLDNVPAGGHTLSLMCDSQTVCDSNDVWSLAVVEMQGPSNVYQLFDNTPCPNQSGGQLIAGGPYTASGGDQLVCVHLSGYSATQGGMLDAHLLIDGDPVGTLHIMANQASSHMLLCGGDIVVGSLPKGSHLIEVVADDGLVTDYNDTVSLTVVELFD